MHIVCLFFVTFLNWLKVLKLPFTHFNRFAFHVDELVVAQALIEHNFINRVEAGEVVRFVALIHLTSYELTITHSYLATKVPYRLCCILGSVPHLRLVPSSSAIVTYMNDLILSMSFDKDVCIAIQDRTSSIEEDADNLFFRSVHGFYFLWCCFSFHVFNLSQMR